jgi:hypothetical protein
MVLSAAIRLSPRRGLNDGCKLSQRSLYKSAHRAHIDLGELPGSPKIAKAGLKQLVHYGGIAPRRYKLWRLKGGVPQATS